MTTYWNELPPEPSPRLNFWVKRVGEGWRPNKRVRCRGYHSAAEFFGVYIAEYQRILRPLIYGPPWRFR